VGWVSKQLADADPDFDALIEKGKVTKSVGLLAPNGTFNQLLEIGKMSDEDIRSLSEPTTVFFYYGKLSYWDIFGCEHWTKFCYRAYPLTGRYDLWESWNDADDNECLPVD
jgi:hypothetical protein